MDGMAWLFIQLCSWQYVYLRCMSLKWTPCQSKGSCQVLTLHIFSILLFFFLCWSSKPPSHIIAYLLERFLYFLLRLDLVVANSLMFCYFCLFVFCILSEGIFIFPSLLRYSFTRYRIWGWQLFCVSPWIMSCLFLLFSMVSDEKLVLLKVVHPFPLVAF